MEVVVDLAEEVTEVVVETTTQEVGDTDHERTLPIKVCRKMKMEDADENEAVMLDVYIGPIDINIRMPPCLAWPTCIQDGNQERDYFRIDVLDEFPHSDINLNQLCPSTTFMFYENM